MSGQSLEHRAGGESPTPAQLAYLGYLATWAPMELFAEAFDQAIAQTRIAPRQPTEQVQALCGWLTETTARKLISALTGLTV